MLLLPVKRDVQALMTSASAIQMLLEEKLALEGLELGLTVGPLVCLSSGKSTTS